MNRSIAMAVVTVKLAFFTISATAGESTDFVMAEPPGIYYAQKADFYLKRYEYRSAIEMFELAGYWGNKTAQYNVGLMYWKGMGVPRDEARGTAWLGISAERHDELAEKTLRETYLKLSADDRKRANEIWEELNLKYGDKVTQARVDRRREEEKRSLTGSHVGFAGNVKVYSSSWRYIGEGSQLVAGIDKSYDNYIGSMYGHVVVESPKGVSAKDNKNPPSEADPDRH